MPNVDGPAQLRAEPHQSSAKSAATRLRFDPRGPLISTTKAASLRTALAF